MHFLVGRVLYLDYIFLLVCSQGFSRQQVSFGSGNNLGLSTIFYLVICSRLILPISFRVSSLAFIEREILSFWWNFLSLAAPEAVKITTFSAAIDENFIKMTTFPFQCWKQSYDCLSASKPRRRIWGNNRLISHIPECTCSISHNAPFRTEMCTFLFWMEHCGIWNRCILGFFKSNQFKCYHQELRYNQHGLWYGLWDVLCFPRGVSHHDWQHNIHDIDTDICSVWVWRLHLMYLYACC